MQKLLHTKLLITDLKRWLLRAGVGLLLVLSGIQVQAQCNRVGWVASIHPGCGAKIIDLKSGELLRAITGIDNLMGGETIRFAAQATNEPAWCSSDGLPTVALTCISDTLPCVADFGYVVNAENAYRLSFVADVFDPGIQHCTWTFGDGSTSTGRTVQHTFSGEGYYTVCLKVTDVFGCATQKCRTIFVSDQNPNWCGYDVEVTAIGTKLSGKLVPVVQNPGTLKSVQWFDNRTNTILAQTADFTAILPGEGTYYICAQYNIANPNNNGVCTTTRCQVITVSSPACKNTNLVNPHATCPTFFAPVCACNGITYVNECDAMADGITKWWTGECGTPSAGSCGSDLDFDIISGSHTAGYTVRFRNLSGGDYSAMQLDFGDGSPVWKGGPGDSIIEHYYPAGGVYRTNLSVWKDNTCVSSVTKLLATSTSGQTTDKMPAGTDYVFPGDMNGDSKANVYDLLNLGLGFGSTGVPRPFATTAWTPQFAPNWEHNTKAGINYKHIDSDGNGEINAFDRNAIEQHYIPIDPGANTVNSAAPKVWIQFAADTIDVDPSVSDPLQIRGEIMLGDANNAVSGLHGLAFALQYSEYVNYDPELDYSNGSFLGIPTDLLTLSKDNADRRQFDVALTRKSGLAASGYGGIGKINFTTDFIIIIDVIERSGTAKVPFFVPVVGLRAVDAAGNQIELEGIVQDTVWLNLLETSTTKQDILQRQTVVFPNPASGEAWLSVGKLLLQHVDVFDAFGRLVESHKPTGNHTTRFDTHSWASGVYFLRIQTAQGIVEKRMIKL